MSRSRPDLDVRWKKITYAFPILKDISYSDCTSEDYEAIHKIIVELGIQVKIRDLTLIHIEKYLRQHVVPPFWAKFIRVPVKDEYKGFNMFKDAVDELYNSLSKFMPMLQRLTTLHNSCGDNKSIYGERTIILGFKLLVRATLHSQLPMDYEDIIHHFYKISFNIFDNNYENSDFIEEMTCPGTSSDTSEFSGDYIVKVFNDTNKKLVEYQLLDRIAAQVITDFLRVRIQTQIDLLCADSYSTSHLGTLESWLEITVVTWLTRVYCAGSPKPPADDVNAKNSIVRFRQKLNYILYETYLKSRIDNIFHIIVEYPDSQPALDDIKLCLTKTNLRSALCDKLKKSIETRVLHPGVATPDIISTYISTIKAMRYLDPTGAILETVTKPIKNYLRNREDTLRSVVSSLTDDGAASELAEELANFPPENAPQQDVEEDWDNWVPEPVEVDPKDVKEEKKSVDILTMLVNVYGSKELFVNEYRTLLADRLLSQTAVDTEKEAKTLEMLKLRFGDSQLHFCDVMLKDILDSKKMNEMIHQNKEMGELNKKFQSNALILSAQFWPPFKDENLELPAEITQHLEAYTKSFESLKGNRTLSWKPHLGNVAIEIEIGGKKVELTVSPFNAALIMHFQTKPKWTIEELHKAMKVSVTILRKKMAYWQTLGIISEESQDCFVLLDITDPKNNAASTSGVQDMVCEDEESESVMASTHDQREGELQVFWSYIVGMLTNLDSLPLERIHQMLKMFASQASGTECSPQELRQFLDTKVKTHQLIFQGGMYKLPKN